MEPGFNCQQAAQVLSRLYCALDERDYDGVARCFHPEGQWHRQGTILHGRDDIVRALRQRSPTLVVHHLYSNCLFESIGQARLKVRYLLTVFQVDPGQAAAGATLFATSPQVGFCDAELVVEADGQWLLARMAARPPAFKAGAWQAS